MTPLAPFAGLCSCQTSKPCLAKTKWTGPNKPKRLCAMSLLSLVYTSISSSFYCLIIYKRPTRTKGIRLKVDILIPSLVKLSILGKDYFPVVFPFLTNMLPKFTQTGRTAEAYVLTQLFGIKKNTPAQRRGHHWGSFKKFYLCINLNGVKLCVGTDKLISFPFDSSNSAIVLTKWVCNLSLSDEPG